MNFPSTAAGAAEQSVSLTSLLSLPESESINLDAAAVLPVHSFPRRVPGSPPGTAGQTGCGTVVTPDSWLLRYERTLLLLLLLLLAQ